MNLIDYFCRLKYYYWTNSLAFSGSYIHRQSLESFAYVQQQRGSVFASVGVAGGRTEVLGHMADVLLDAAGQLRQAAACGQVEARVCRLHRYETSIDKSIVEEAVNYCKQ